MARFWQIFETGKLTLKFKFHMKKVLLTLTVFASAICATAQTTTTAPASAQKPAAPASLAEITFETDVHDFGTIAYGGNGTYEFKFKNTGKEPLIISEAKGSCGCTVPTYPKNVPIKPGESQVIKVTYDTKRAGNFTKTVSIQSNAKTPEKVITIKGNVEPAPVEEAFPANGKKDDGATPFEKH
jgi:archaellum component FlaG (FlaF/FlaG flagellin family)